MKYLAAYTLLTLAGKTPTESDVTKLLAEVGIEVDAAAVKKVCDTLKGKNLEEVIAEGSKKVSSLSFGGASGQAAPAVAAAKAAPVAAKVEVKKEEAPVEEDMDVGGFFDEEF